MATNKALGGKDTMKRRRWKEGHINQVWGRKVYIPLASKGL